MEKSDSVKQALVRCAVGLSASEVVEEFSADGDGQLKLVKRKVTKRDIPPDLKAVKMLIDGEDVTQITDEELIAERRKLTDMLKEDKVD
ncbi:MAG: hypothetical protein ACI4MS_02280 [Candidatus Coproplasma sp.]